jgi:CheY-like chemotaxis protein
MILRNLTLLNPYTIRDLAGRLRQTDLESIASKRRKIQICVIDDQEFRFLPLFQQHGYDIDYFSDQVSVEKMSKYQIILCDLKDVFTGMNLQGAAFIAQLRKRNKFAFIIGYTGASPSTIIYREAAKHCDFMIEKKKSPEEIMTIIDRYIIELLDNSIAWKKIRTDLSKSDIAAVDVALLEHYFVKSIINRNPEIIESVLPEFEIAEHAKKLIPEAIAALIKIGVS